MKNLLLVTFLFFNACYSYSEKPWDNGFARLYIADSFSDAMLMSIDKAIERVNTSTNFRFKIVSKPGAYICDVIKSTEHNNSATIGQYEDCYVELDDYANHYRGYSIALHELGHVIGLHHEQSRSDRDLYITVHWENVTPGYEYNFEIKDQMYDINTLGYDYDSLMHYDSFIYSHEGKPTMTTIHGDILDYDPLDFTATDITKINDIYP